MRVDLRGSFGRQHKGPAGNPRSINRIGGQFLGGARRPNADSERQSTLTWAVLNVSIGSGPTIQTVTVLSDSIARMNRRLTSPAQLGQQLSTKNPDPRSRSLASQGRVDGVVIAM
jgi:hypothetical protein